MSSTSKVVVIKIDSNTLDMQEAVLELMKLYSDNNVIVEVIDESISAPVVIAPELPVPVLYNLTDESLNDTVGYIPGKLIDNIINKYTRTSKGTKRNRPWESPYFY